MTDLSILDLYNRMLNGDYGKRISYYENVYLNNNFLDLNYSDIIQYFTVGGKQACLPDEVKGFFTIDNQGMKRVQHMFSVYLSGIYCYDNIPKVCQAFNQYIKKIWRKSNRVIVGDSNIDDDNLRRDFLYIWFLTSLFHDIGYPVEKEAYNESSEYTSIISNEEMMSKKYLGNTLYVLGIPQKIRKASPKYFYHRRNSVKFNDNLCVDHGFAGGLRLFQILKKLHYKNRSRQQDDWVCKRIPYNENRLIFSPIIFRYYNIPAAWAIICHNIWLAESGTEREYKYLDFSLGDLVYTANNSPIKCEKHPLLFLLDFIDTIGFSKKMDDMVDLNNIYLSTNHNEIFFSFESQLFEKNTDIFKIVDDDLSFLKSQSFNINVANNGIKFIFI